MAKVTVSTSVDIQLLSLLERQTVHRALELYRANAESVQQQKDICQSIMSGLESVPDSLP